MIIPSEILQNRITIPQADGARRIISLSSGYTEALFAMGFGDRVVGVSAYCSRYAACEKLPVVGDYLQVDCRLLEDLQPDLILLTSGIQLKLARKLVEKGYPAHVLPLPSSIGAVCDGFVQLSAFCGDAETGRRFTDDLMEQLLSLRSRWQGKRTTLYAEAWFGRHARMIGSVTFMQDILRYSGAEPLFSSESWAFAEPDLEKIGRHRPEVFLGFSEPEYPVDFLLLSRERGWQEQFAPSVIVSDVTRGRNIIHDGPSLVETVAWLQEELRKALHLQDD